MLTLFAGLDRPDGSALDVAWSDVPNVLRALDSGMLFACARYENDYHSLAAVKANTAIVLDHDAATIPIDSVVCALSEFDAYIYATKRPGRWRAIVRTTRDMTPEEYRRYARELALSLDCADESARPAQIWFPPNGEIYSTHGAAIELDNVEPSGDARLDAWIAGDWKNPCIASDLPRKPQGAPDRSAVDMLIVTRMVGLGAKDEAIVNTICGRGNLSHRTDTAYVSKSIAKARKRSEERAEDAERAKAIFLGDAKLPIVMVGNDLARVADDAIDTLSLDPDLYVRDGRLVVIAREPTRAVALSITTIRERLSRCAIFAKETKKGISQVPPPNDIAAQIFYRNDWPGIRKLQGISDTPIVRPDGSIAQSEGYDARTGYLCTGGVKATQSAAPTRDDAVSALLALRRLFKDFPFESSAMIDVPIAALIATVCRPAIRGNVPLFAFDASTQASGKTLLSDTICTIATGYPGAKTPFPRGEEQAKVLAAFALAGSPLITFDNAQAGAPICGDTLDAVLTANGKVTFRILGQSKMQFSDWHAVLTVTGNQLTIVGDTRRRAVRARLVPQCDYAAERRFDTDLEAYVPANREALLNAALTVFRAYRIAGRPLEGKGDARGSFGEFLASVADAIVWAGGYDIRECWREERNTNDARDAMLTVHDWIALRWPQGATAAQIVDDLGGEGWVSSPAAQALFRSDPDIESRVKDLMLWLGETHGKATKRQALAYALRSWRDVFAGGRRLVGTEGRNTKWQLSVSTRAEISDMH